MQHNRKEEKPYGLKSGISIVLPEEGRLGRTFPTKGKAIAFLEHRYGRAWKKMRIRFEGSVAHE